MVGVFTIGDNHVMVLLFSIFQAAKQVTMTGAQEKTACKVAAVEDTGKHLQTNPGHSSRDVSHIPRPFNRVLLFTT